MAQHVLETSRRPGWLEQSEGGRDRRGEQRENEGMIMQALQAIEKMVLSRGVIESDLCFNTITECYMESILKWNKKYKQEDQIFMTEIIAVAISLVFLLMSSGGRWDKFGFWLYKQKQTQQDFPMCWICCMWETEVSRMTPRFGLHIYKDGSYL